MKAKEGNPNKKLTQEQRDALSEEDKKRLGVAPYQRKDVGRPEGVPKEVYDTIKYKEHLRDEEDRKKEDDRIKKEKSLVQGHKHKTTSKRKGMNTMPEILALQEKETLNQLLQDMYNNPWAEIDFTDKASLDRRLKQLKVYSKMASLAKQFGAYLAVKSEVGLSEDGKKAVNDNVYLLEQVEKKLEERKRK